MADTVQKGDSSSTHVMAIKCFGCGKQGNIRRNCKQSSKQNSEQPGKMGKKKKATKSTPTGDKDVTKVMLSEVPEQKENGRILLDYICPF